MAKSTGSVPRRRGRPKRNVDALVTDVLIECLVQWLTGRALNLDRAVRQVVSKERADQEKLSVKELRERVRARLKDATRDQEELLLRAFDVAQERGEGIGWMQVPLQRFKLMRQAADRSLVGPPKRGMLDVDRVRRLRLVWFRRAFDDLLPLDIPISKIAQDFDAVHAFIERRQKSA
jgi:hypothetical protein